MTRKVDHRGRPLTDKSPPGIEVFAPAKINLTLHVTGRRDDGYHLLDSLVVFADIGDRVLIRDLSEAAEGEQGQFAVAGLESGNLPVRAEDNLVAKALDVAVAERMAPFVLLTKDLPVSSGIGGGSTDAAAALRAVAHEKGLELRDPAFLDRLANELGADVPMCLDPRPWRVSGIGEVLSPVDAPELHAVLVNPRVPVSTPAVFKRLERADNAPMDWPPETGSVAGFCDWLGVMRNDLEAAACAVAPEIGGVLARLGQLPGARIARMSGSGATCFAIFETEDSAREAEAHLRVSEPTWWVRKVVLGNMSEAAQPRLVPPP